MQTVPDASERNTSKHRKTIEQGYSNARVVAWVTLPPCKQAFPRVLLQVIPAHTPFLSLLQLVDENRDSPQFRFNVTVQHLASSKYDARDVLVTDTTKDMNIERSSFSPPDDTSLSFPEQNVYKISFNVPKLRGTDLIYHSARKNAQVMTAQSDFSEIVDFIRLF